MIGSSRFPSSEPPRIPRYPVFDRSALGTGGHAPYLLAHPDRTLTSSGSAAIAMVLRAMEIGPGAGVLVPTLHCPTMIEPVVSAGASPVFFPVDEAGVPDFGFLDRQHPGVRLICVPHFYGVPQPMRRLRDFAHARGWALLEDCAHALFGSADGQPIGSWGDYAIGSLVKFLPLSEGGVLVTNSDVPRPAAGDRPGVLASARAAFDLMEIRAPYRTKGAADRVSGAMVGMKKTVLSVARRSAPKPAPVETDAAPSEVSPGPGRVGPASGMTEYLVRRFDYEMVATARRANFRSLLDAWSDLADAEPFVKALDPTMVPYVFPLRVRDPDAVQRRLFERGIPVMRWNSLWKGTPRLAGDAGIRLGGEVLQLPCHQSLGAADVAWLADAVRTTLGETARPGRDVRCA